MLLFVIDNRINFDIFLGKFVIIVVDNENYEVLFKFLKMYKDKKCIFL